MNETLQQIVNACVPILCLLITAGGAYLVALLRRETRQIQQELDNEVASKYMDMAVDAVTQAVTYTAQTFVDTLKAEGAFTKEKQIEAFTKAKDKTLEILGNTAIAALGEIYGDFDAWLSTKIEQVCREIKAPNVDAAAATTAAATAASVASTIATTAVQQLAAEGTARGTEVSAEVEITTGKTE
uniref:hypothetical protein n=1 Tax=Candidatus Fimenecus sp. TaxID=3022888 RepID=UPI003FED8878